MSVSSFNKQHACSYSIPYFKGLTVSFSSLPVTHSKTFLQLYIHFLHSLKFYFLFGYRRYTELNNVVAYFIAGQNNSQEVCEMCLCML